MTFRIVSLPLLLTLIAPWCTTAAEAPPVMPPQVATDAGAKPILGVQVDPGKENSFDGGIVVSAVKPGTAAAAMGIQPADIILAINGRKMARMDDLQAVIGAAKVGDVVTVDFTRKGEKLTKSGPLQAPPPPPKPTGQAMSDLQKDIDRLKARRDREPTLPEMLDDIVTQLNTLEKNLPKASEAFKKQYPNGEFDISITIKISSDKNAKNPVEINPSKDGKDDKDVAAPKPAVPDAPAPAPVTPKP
ncbi:MAG: PDZ domain-containing protein [Planctomycetes bacterium]|nr:PDZ domain-containing protein [Planctomycetota bacterium]